MLFAILPIFACCVSRGFVIAVASSLVAVILIALILFLVFFCHRNHSLCFKPKENETASAGPLLPIFFTPITKDPLLEDDIIA